MVVIPKETTYKITTQIKINVGPTCIFKIINFP